MIVLSNGIYISDVSLYSLTACLLRLWDLVPLMLKKEEPMLSTYSGMGFHIKQTHYLLVYDRR